MLSPSGDELESFAVAGYMDYFPLCCIDGRLGIVSFAGKGGRDLDFESSTRIPHSSVNGTNETRKTLKN